MLVQFDGFAVTQQVVMTAVFWAFAFGSFCVQVMLVKPYRLRRKPRGKTPRPPEK